MNYLNVGGINFTRTRFGVVLGLAIAFLALARPAEASINVLADFVAAPNGLQPQTGLILAKDGNYYGTTSTGGPSGNGTVFKITSAGALTTLVAFDGGANGGRPESLIQGADGNFYGSTYYGGAFSYGTLFKMTSAGALTTLASLTTTSGYNLAGSLAEDAGGNFYALTTAGGGDSDGTLFKLTPNGVLTGLVSFAGEGPTSGLIEGVDGNIYGTIASHAASGARIVEVTPSGTLATVVSMTNAPANLIQTSDGTFYGTTTTGVGAQSNAIVFSFSPGGGVSTVANFGAFTFPQSLVLGSDGNLYGTALGGSSPGPAADGTFFKVAPTGGLTIIRSFPDDTGAPFGPLVLGSDGNFYGTTFGNNGTTFGSVFSLTPAGNATALFTFANDGPVKPEGALVQTKDGSFYGTTYGGGAFGDGTVFEMSPDGIISTLASFNGTNGENPRAGLVLAKDGNFYGTTYAGGTSGDGTVFRVTPAGVLTSLVSFNGTNGANPYAALIQAKDGNLYGTTFATYNGGAGQDGTIFKMTLSGALTTLVTFNGTNGANPYASLLQAKDGNFYGTTDSGGKAGGGTAFRLTPEGAFTTLASFIGSNGYRPEGTLVQGLNGDLYGTTNEGVSNISTIFEMTLAGAVKTLVTSATYDGVGDELVNGLLLAKDGDFYLAADYAGPTGMGDVYQVTPAGTLRDFGDFDGTNGSIPLGPPIQGSDGSLYGTASGGGAAGDGAVYQVPLLGQKITFPRLYPQTIGETTPVTLEASSSSGLPVTYRLVEGAALLQGNVLTVNGGGQVIVAADQAGNETYGPAPEVTQGLYVFPGTQKLTFPEIPDQIYGVAPFLLQATVTPAGPIVFTATGPAQLISVPNPPNTAYYLSITGPGVVTVTATAPANQSYRAASATQSLNVYVSTQTISFPKVGEQTLTGLNPSATVTLGATATSSLPVIYHVISGPGTVSGNVLTFTGPGAVVVRASQPGNADFAPAPMVTQGIVAVAPKVKLGQAILAPAGAVISYRQLPVTVPLMVSATSGLPVTLKYISGPATLSGNSLTVTGPGTIVIQASQAGNASTPPAPMVTFSIQAEPIPTAG